MMKLLLLVFLLLIVSSLSLVEVPERGRGGQLYKERASLSSSSSSLSLSWNASIDNFDDSNSNTYEQRYFTNNEYWNGKGPVFLYIGGEGTLSSSSIERGYITYLAKSYSALLVSVEHRYYGQSLPTSSSTENLKKYLTVEQALADLNSFTKYFKSKNIGTDSVAWVAFGGSYPGALSAYYRISYPDDTVGSLASSGVVNPIVNFQEFDETVSTAIGNTCADSIKRINNIFEVMTKTKEGLQKALGMFNCEDDLWIEDFFYMIADSFSMAVQYSQKSSLCDAVVTSTPVSDDELIKKFTSFSLTFWGKDFCRSGFYNTNSLANVDKWDVNSRSWRFQTCYQMSMFNTAPQTGNLRSSMVNLDYHLRQCSAMFGENLEPAKGTMMINEKFGGAHPVGHNIFFSDFSDDPWQRASVTYITSSDLPYSYVKGNNCGHCLDLGTPNDDDSEELKQSRQNFESYMKKWIDSYKR